MTYLGQKHCMELADVTKDSLCALIDDAMQTAQPYSTDRLRRLAAENEEAARKLQQNKFDLDDLLAQFQQVKKMGSMKSLLSKLPGMDKQLRDVDIDDRQLVRVESIIYSMTEKERRKPEIINASRKKRIAAGSGVKVEDVNRLLKQHEQMKKMFKQMNKPGKKQRGFPGGMPGGMPGMPGPGGFRF